MRKVNLCQPANLIVPMILACWSVQSCQRSAKPSVVLPDKTGVGTAIPPELDTKDRTAPKPDATLAAKLKSWEIAWEESGSIYISHGDFKDKRVAIKDAKVPTWSSDGRYLAYIHKDKVFVKDFKSGKVSYVCERPIDRGDYFDPVLCFDPIRPYLLVPVKDEIVVYDFTDPKHHLPAASRHAPWVEGAPAISPSGNLYAFTRNGDVWIAKRPNGGGEPELEYGQSYFDEAERIAPIAGYYDTEGGSASTPYLPDSLLWIDEKTILFHFQRVHASGSSTIGYLDLDLDFHRGKDAQEMTKIRRLPENMVFNPALCPDGKTLTMVMHDDDTNGSYSLFVIDKDAKRLAKIEPEFITSYAWRPRPVSRKTK